MKAKTKWAERFASARPGSGFGIFRRLFFAYVGVAFWLLVLAAAAGWWQTRASVTPKTAMKRMAASVSATFFIDMVGLESAHLKRSEGSAFSTGNVTAYLIERLLHINPVEPKTLLASEFPGLRGERLSPHGEKPAPSEGVADAGAADRRAPGADGASSGGSASNGPEPQPVPAVRQGNVGPQPEPTDQADAPPGSEPVKPTTQGKKVVFIYHSHPRESWVSELGAKTLAEAEDPETNVTLVGKRLAEKLEEEGIGAVHSAVDYPSAVPGYNWNFSYKYSLQTVREAFAQHKDIQFLFDLHRDSAGRDVTTANIDGRDCAKVYFIVGKKNDKWEQNEAFAKRIHDKLEAKYPGLSRGIWDKGSGGHAEYNQSVSQNSILIEIGGAFNTLEESYRTADMLAETIAELYWDAEKVNASATARR